VAVETTIKQQKTTKSMKTNLIRHIASLAVTLAVGTLLVGCASGPKYADYVATIKPPANGQGRIWFYRPSILGAAVQPDVKLDGKKVGSAVPQGFFIADTNPGVHEVSATTEWTHKNPVTVHPNADSYVRLNMMMGLFVGHVIPREVSPAEAREEIKDTKLAQ
jgi:hypothetical protein